MRTGFIDIHNHMMPDVDDGSKDIDMSKRMLKQAYKEGITNIILTPHYKQGHYHPDLGTCNKLSEELNNYAKSQGMSITFHCGNELQYFSDALDRIQCNKLLTLAGSKYLLVEFNPMDDYSYIRSGLQAIIYGGYTPILAHVERYNCLINEYTLINELIALGAVIQVNSGSITGDYGKIIKKFCYALLEDNLIHVVATDAHRDKGRSPKMKKCYKVVSRKFSSEYADKLFIENPRFILLNESIL